jgi:hypothetical protein
MTLITGTAATAAGSATLATLRDRVEQVLSDTGNATWSTAALDEAIRHTLDAYTLVNPHRAITTLTLSAAGREVDVSSITNLLEVQRVWWEYTASDPEHPPNWREFEQWPGPILWINTGLEPASGDVIRLWYTARHTLTDLDSATTTTIPNEHVSLIVAGAAAQAALIHAQSIGPSLNVDGWTPRRFNEWAAIKDSEFKQGLAQIARRRAAQSAGIAPAAALDRWEGEGW